MGRVNERMPQPRTQRVFMSLRCFLLTSLPLPACQMHASAGRPVLLFLAKSLCLQDLAAAGAKPTAPSFDIESQPRPNRNHQMKSIRTLLISTLVFAPMVGCGEKQMPEPSNDSAMKVASSPSELARPAKAKAPAPAPAPAANSLRGTVKETMASGGYTYLLLASEKGEFWAAAKQFSVAVGDDVEVAGMMPMSNFHSKTLDRTFEIIQFVGRAAVVGGEAGSEVSQQSGAMPPGHPPIGGALSAPPASDSPQAKITPLEGGMTVAELFEKKADLGGKTVQFRGRVVKASKAIMAKNWLHIQDGTGEPGSNDITVTSEAGYADVGTIVIVEGIIALEKDFGAGYKYDVIVEEATISTDAP